MVASRPPDLLAPVMTLAQIDQQIAKWKQLQSNVSIKLVDLDEMPTYLGIVNGLFEGTTAASIGGIKGSIETVWALSAAWNEAFEKALAARAHSPLPWDKERWQRDLEAKLQGPVVARPSLDSLAPPTMTLGQALTEIVNEYDRVIDLIGRIDARLGQSEAKTDELNRLAESLGATRLKSELSEVGDQIRSDPLGVSMDSFASIETRLRRFRAEVDERRTILDALDRGERRVRDADRLSAEADARAEDCRAKLGKATPVPRPSLEDLLDWSQTLRAKLSDAELSSMKVGLARWEAALESRTRPQTEADHANRDLLARYREVAGRFSAAQAQAAGTYRQSGPAEQLAHAIRAGLARSPKDVDALERDLVAYERLIRG